MNRKIINGVTCFPATPQGRIISQRAMRSKRIKRNYDFQIIGTLLRQSAFRDLGLLCTNDSIYKNQFSIIIKPVMIISIFIIFVRVSVF